MKKTIFPAILLCCLSLNASAIDPVKEATISITPDSSVYEALRHAREMRRLGQADHVTIRLAEGIYRLDQTLVIRPEDSNITFRGIPGKTIVTGSVAVGGWHRKGKVLETTVADWHGRPLFFRQMWTAQGKAVRARSVAAYDDMKLIRWVDKKKQTIWVPAETVKSLVGKDGRLLPGAQYAEMVLHEMWAVANLRIKSIFIDGDTAAVTFHQPESQLQFDHPWPSPMYNSKHNSPYYICNASQLLDEPGEWYYDRRTSKLQYMPRKGETAANMQAEVPVLETLVRVVGTIDRKVENVRFTGISFCGTGWLRPSEEGHVPLQAGMYLTEAYKLRPKIDRPNNHKLDNQGWLGRATAAVEIMYGDDVKIDSCQLSQMGGSGIDYVIGCNGGGVNCCDIHDVAMNAVVTGSFSPEGLETHLPYRPSDLREVCSGQVISNNHIHHVTNEDWGCCAVTAGYVSDLWIDHNEIDHVSYTGISMGWGWNRDKVVMHNNRVTSNYIHHYAEHMYDCAGIYTLGNQPGTVIEENVVDSIFTPQYVHDPQHWFYLYTDEGSANITLRNNWTPAEKFLKNACGPNNIWQNNGPQVSEEIKKKAGTRKASEEKVYGGCSTF